MDIEVVEVAENKLFDGKVSKSFQEKIEKEYGTGEVHIVQDLCRRLCVSFTTDNLNCLG